MNEYLAYLILISSILLSGVLVYVIKNKQLLKMFLAFSGGYLLALLMVHLIPEIFQKHAESIAIWILVGFLVQIILEYFSQGIEHGHIHHKDRSGKVFPTVLFISLCVHTFVEGIPLEREFHAVAHHGSDHEHESHTLFWGIVLHNVPIAIALMTLFLNSSISKTKAWIFLIIFSLMAPAGAFIGHHFGNLIGGQTDEILDIILAIVIGMLLHISTTIIYETSENHRFNFFKIMSVAAGLLLSFFSHWH